MTFKVLHVLDHSLPLHSGYTFRTLAILQEQRKRGWETMHLTSSKQYGTDAEENWEDGWHFYRTRVPRNGYRTLPIIGQLAVIRDLRRRMEPLLDRLSPNLVHAHSPCLNGIAAIWACRSRGIPVVYEMRALWEDAAVDHGSTREGSLRYRLSRGLETWTLGAADQVTTICEGLKLDICSRGVPEDRVTVVPNAVDPSRFAIIDRPDADLQASFGLRDRFTIGFIGSFYAYEGLADLIEAMPDVLVTNSDARLLLVGGGPEDATLRRRVDDLGLQEFVRFTGRVPHHEVHRYYGLIDLLAYPRRSIRLTETVTPLKPLEAMAQGRLLIASDVGGHRELIRDRETGFLFRPGSASAIAEAVSRVRSLGADSERVRHAARAFVERERNWSYSVSRYDSVYARAVANVPIAR